MRVTNTGAIITRTPIPRRHLYLAALFSPDALVIVIVAASQQALEAQAEITAALTQWGAVTWPDDPEQIWTNAATPTDETFVHPEILDELPGPWSPLLTRPDVEPSEGALSEEAPDWTQVDISQSEENDAEEEEPAALAADALNPVDEGAPPEEEADPRPDEPATEPDGGEDGEELVGDGLTVSEKIARALARRSGAADAALPDPPWRNASRPPRGTAPTEGGSRQRAAPQPPGESTQQSGRVPRGNKDAQRAAMGLSSSSTAGGPGAPPAYPALGPNDSTVRARLAAALVRARAQAEAAQAEVTRMEAEETQREAWTPAETLPASGATPVTAHAPLELSRKPIAPSRR